MDRLTVMGYLEGLTQDDWHMFHSDSEVQEIAKAAFELLKKQDALAVDERKVNKCVCGNEINRYWYPEYCGFCGKKLEWY